ncbi:hypothetical protein ABZY06_33975 [Streptomyces sp. NPDC006540]|uniref:VG15 protein n=1 Tax=Streptomyces sp. NPDC006540 TaxID=3155353 RepID=UPI0033A7EBE0
MKAIQALWLDVTPDRILAAMSGSTGLAILNAVMLGQVSVAQGAQAFVTGAMLAQGASTTTLGTVAVSELAGLAMDGRALTTLLYLPAMTTATLLAQGAAPDRAAASGVFQLARLASTVLSDTARTATQVAMTATPSCVRYVRTVKLPACSRCIILAGREYSYSTGFRRHPGCDCGMEPVRSDAEWRAMSSPESLYKQMTPEERVKRFGAAAVEALDNGADIGQIVNARRGMSTATVHGKQVQVTREGTTKRGIGGKALDAGFSKKFKVSKYQRSNQRRLMPEEILRLADDREHQIRLLKKHGFILD